ncbi:MAG TPA: MMPL family transporter [Phycisphaerales bacterium]|nr:MMPL family transporter [Phycisphaerales bacterium]
MSDHAARSPTWLRRLLALPVDHANVTLACTAIVIIASILLVLRLKPTGSLEPMIAANNPAAVALSRIFRDFGSLDDLLLVVSIEDSGISEADARHQLVTFAERLEADIRNDPAIGDAVLRVRWRLGPDSAEQRFIQKHVVPNGLLYLTDVQFAGAVDRLTPEAMREQLRRDEELIAAPGLAADRLAQTLLQDPLRLRESLLAAVDPRALGLPAATAGSFEDDTPALFSVDGRSLLIRLSGAKPVSDLDFTKSFLAMVQRAVEHANTQGLLIEYTGSYAIAAASERAIRSDMISSVLSAVLLMQLLFLALYRRLASFVLAFGPTAIAILASFGLFSALSLTLTPATAVVGAVLAGLGDDFSIHFLSHYDHHREGGRGAREAAIEAAAELVAPMLAALLTSLVGLLAILQSSVPALHDFAWLSSMGLTGSMLASLTILPALLVTLERVGRGRRWMLAGHRMRLDGLIGVVYRRRAWSMAAIVVVWIAAAAIVAQRASATGAIMPFASDLRIMHPQPNPALDLQEQLSRRFGGSSSSMLLHVQADTPDDLLRVNHAISAALRQPPVRDVGVTGVLSLAALLPDPTTLPARLSGIEGINSQRVLADFDAAVGESIFAPAAFADSRKFLAEFLHPVPPRIGDLQSEPALAAMLLPRAAAQSGSPPDESIALVFLDHPQRDLAERDAAIIAIRNALAPIKGGRATLTGLVVLGHDTQQSIRRELFLMAGFAIAAVITLLLVFYRRPLDVLLVLLPLAFGITCVMAFMHLTGDGLNPINLIGIPLLIGTGEDYGVYVISLARQARGAGESVEQLRERLASSIHALSGTWMTTLLGFGSLMFTSTPAIQSLGRMTTVGAIACFVCTTYGLVPLLLVLHQRAAKLDAARANSRIGEHEGVMN